MGEINLNGQITLFKVKNGKDGAPGGEGAPGKSAYDLWKEEGGNTGTVEDFLESLQGSDGATPYIQDGYWYINGENTGVKAEGTPAYKAIITYKPPEDTTSGNVTLQPNQSINLTCQLYAGLQNITDNTGVSYNWYNKNNPSDPLETGKDYSITLEENMADFIIVCKCYINNVECAFDEFSLSEIIETTIYEVELVGTPSRFKIATISENSTDWVYKYEISPETLPFHIYKVSGNSKEEITQSIYIGNSKNTTIREGLTYQGNYYSFSLKQWHTVNIGTAVDEINDDLLPVQFYLYLNEEDVNPIGSFSFVNAEEGKRMDVSLTASKWQALIDDNSMVFNTNGLTLYNGVFKIASATISNGEVSSSTDLFYYDTTNTSLYIKTNYARIGGWCIGGSDTINNEQYTYSNNNQADTLYSSNKEIWLSPNGISTTINKNTASMVFKAGSNFGVDTSGNLYASSAKITGEIEATSLLLHPGVAQDAGLATSTQVTNAGKTATNFLQFVDGTLTIGDIAILNNSKEAGSYYYTQITNKSFDIGRKRWYIDSTTNAPTPEETKLVSFSKEIQFYPGDDGINGGSIDYVNNVEYISSDPHLQLSSRNLIMLGTDSAKLCVGADGLRSISLIEARLDDEGKSFINLKNKRYSSDVYGLEIRGDGVFYCSGSNKFGLIHKGNIFDYALNKLSYEWNVEYNAGGTAGYLLIGSFPMYDTNITINIDSTTTTTYHGTVVIATQNVDDTTMGSAHTITVYEDPTGAISDAIRVVWASGSRNYNVYFAPSTWSKNLIHIRAIGNYLSDFDKTTLCKFYTGNPPATTSGLEVINALKTQLMSKANVITALGYTPLSPNMVTAGNNNVTISVNSNTNEVTIYAKDTTYNMVSKSANGLMYASDKDKLDHIEAGANKYSLPTASSSTLGGVKTTSSVTSTSGLTACPIISGVPYYKDTNTTYSANNGISLSGTTFSNSGVRSISTGSTNGTISVNTGGSSAEVAIKNCAVLGNGTNGLMNVSALTINYVDLTTHKTSTNGSLSRKYNNLGLNVIEENMIIKIKQTISANTIIKLCEVSNGRPWYGARIPVTIYNNKPNSRIFTGYLTGDKNGDQDAKSIFMKCNQDLIAGETDIVILISATYLGDTLLA